MTELEAHVEARREAAPLVLVALVLLVLLALVSRQEGWQLLHRVPWWAWLLLAVPELILIVDFILRETGARGMKGRRFVLVNLGLLLAGNLVALVFLVAGLVTTSTTNLGGGELLMSAAVVWFTNVIIFAIWFWEADLGGPVARALLGSHVKPDFQFPQDENPRLKPEGWCPKLWDYLYVSLTNSIAFSPTDAMPLSRHAKLLMGLESTISLVTVLLVAARAVNVLGA